MTKVKVYGQEPQEEKKLKPIEFLHGIDTRDLEFFKTTNTPQKYKEINVFKRYSENSKDLFVCYTEEGYRHIFLGNFNDGVVE